MKNVLLIFAGLCFSLIMQAQTPSVSVLSNITEAEAGDGIKETLNQGVEKAVSALNKTDGFFGNEFYKILLPPEVQKVESKMRSVGLDGQLDKAILQINRGAEAAVGAAKPIFISAIKQITISDALNLIKGPNGSVTQYFRNKTNDSLIVAFTPVVKSSLEKTKATQYYDDIIKVYNKIPFNKNKLNPDLTSYVVDRAIDALFDMITKEETEIRKNPAKRTSEILKKTFGGIN